MKKVISPRSQYNVPGEHVENVARALLLHDRYCITNSEDREFLSRRSATIGSGLFRWSGSSCCQPRLWGFVCNFWKFGWHLWHVKIILFAPAENKGRYAVSFVSEMNFV